MKVHKKPYMWKMSLQGNKLHEKFNGTQYAKHDIVFVKKFMDLNLS